MKNPFKIIHKFKNDNNKIQYLVYIFIGEHINKELKDILESISEKDFYDTLIYLTVKKRKSIEDIYGKKWYKFFFYN